MFKESKILRVTTYKGTEGIRPPTYEKKITGGRDPAVRRCYEKGAATKIRPDPDGG